MCSNRSKTIAIFIFAIIVSFTAGILSVIVFLEYHRHDSIIEAIEATSGYGYEHEHRAERHYGFPEGISQSIESQTLNVDQEGTTRGP